jgi:hypothetical protein
MKICQSGLNSQDVLQLRSTSRYLQCVIPDLSDDDVVQQFKWMRDWTCSLRAVPTDTDNTDEFSKAVYKRGDGIAYSYFMQAFHNFRLRRYPDFPAQYFGYNRYKSPFDLNQFRRKNLDYVHDGLVSLAKMYHPEFLYHLECDYESCLYHINLRVERAINRRSSASAKRRYYDDFEYTPEEEENGAGYDEEEEVEPYNRLPILSRPLFDFPDPYVNNDENDQENFGMIALYDEYGAPIALDN